MTDTRLIERWLPIAELGIESTRERTPMTPFPAPNRLHVWWARRPLVAARAAVLASLLPAEADRAKFIRVLGIHGDPVASRRRIDAARRRGERFAGNAYSYPRAFGYVPAQEDRQWFTESCGKPHSDIVVLDPTAGGGSIPFETIRLGAHAIANDLNPVSALVMRATLEWPSIQPDRIGSEFKQLAARFVRQRDSLLAPYFPAESDQRSVSTNFLWARTITCPYCDGTIPLSPNWRLAPDGTGVRLHPYLGKGPGSPGRICSFEIVQSAQEQSAGTVLRGDGKCPYSDCEQVIDGDEIKQQAQAGQMGEQLYAVVYKKRVERILKSGKRGKDKWVRGYRAPRPEDDNAAEIQAKLSEKLPEWEALDIVPTEKFPEDSTDDRPIQYGMPLWRDLFSPRQLLCHCTSVEVFREMLEADRKNGMLDDVRKAAYGYLALSLDKLLNYNSRMARWHANRSVMVGTFDRHDFAFCWSHAEMTPLATGLGYDWAIEQTAKCIEDLVALLGFDVNGPQNEMFEEAKRKEIVAPRINITCKPGDSLDHVEDESIDAVVIDPPYYDNVMYAELADYFYVWLKRTAGHLFPELFRGHLSNKSDEAVANPTRFQGQKGARMLAEKDYQQRMASIFAECHRVLKRNGIMTLMFTHKATGAWDALTKGLMEAGFVITASWPINTEASGSLHIKDKAAANSTIFLVCRPRHGTETAGASQYWEDVEPQVAQAVRARVESFQEAGITGVDLYLASFGPALEEFSRHWPLKRGTPREMPVARRRRQQQVLFEEDWDPYAATPEDALDTARREVKRWRLEQLTHLKANADLDPSTAFFVLAWDAFKAPQFSYDEALRLARAVGVDMDRDIIGRLAEKKGSDIRLWDSTQRAAKGALGPADGSRSMIDALHHAANMAQVRTLAASREMLEKSHVDKDPGFFAALEAVLEVLPISKTYTEVDLPSEAVAAGNDFEALYSLSRLAYGEEIDEPAQMSLILNEIA